MFSRCVCGVAPVRFPIMRLLGLLLLLIACSSGTEAGSKAVESGGAAGESATIGAGQGGSTAAAGTAPRAGATGEAMTAGEAAGGASATGEGGGSAAQPGAGAGGEPEDGGEAGAGGAPAGGMPTSGGSSGSASQAGSSAAGSGPGGAADSGGGPVMPDVCDGIPRWSPTERWTDYEQGDQRVFGGVLWHCQAPSVCTAYPGHASSPGWFKDAVCKSGPTNEVAACQCLTGQCCDGCYVRPSSYFCGEVVRTAQCTGPVVEQCGGARDTIDKDYWNLFCDGAESTTCSRWGAHKKYTNGDCPAKTGCVESGDQASCVACAP